ncbi:MAG: hypothetical protein HETSPECPRED_009993 [Heterodermia speciosa]|uniref:Enoyl reductase (ER) domain-containing protein n=1 Tax=Heterodermia speciosa TaxID=116794 RepID=A0A8H3IWV6_9LECA|nr:MAG: hypothetical protein HETSPECPRED_009993 [Heterodermia speciosa]
MPATTHRAAILAEKGGPLSLTDRPTPSPAPHEILLEVKAVALNPVDLAQRDTGFPPVPSYPAVLGSDVAGLIAAVGSRVPNAPAVGSRAVAFASAFYHDGSADHGAFQGFVLAPWEGVVGLPDGVGFEEGAVCPLAAMTALTAWTVVGIPLGTEFTPGDGQAVLIWGAASSVGTFAVQAARLMGFRVYATASAKHHAYLKGLGADVVFDYRAGDVVDRIVDRVREDGVVLRTANCVVQGSLQPTLDVLKVTKGDAVAKVAHTPVLLPGAPTLDGVEVKFNMPSMDLAERKEHMYKCFHGWLRNGLDSGTVVPSPRIQVEDEGLEGLNRALDKLKDGLSGTKIVVRI